MSNSIYPKWKEALLQGLSNTSLTGTVKAVLIDLGAYTYDPTHDFLDDVASGARVGTPQTLTTKTFVNGVFDADNVSFPTVSGPTVEALLLYIDTGVEATSYLVAYIDSSVVGLPDTPSGGNIQIIWDNGTYRIFAI